MTVGDLPEGQQSKAIVDEAEREAVRRWLDGYAARVRADVAEEIARDLELSERGQQQTAARRRGEGMDARAEVHDLLAQAYGVAADRAREHAVAPAESVVGAPTPYAEGFAEAVRRLRDDDRYAAAPEHLRQWNADVRYSLATYLESDAPVGALPEDEGTEVDHG